MHRPKPRPKSCEPCTMRECKILEPTAPTPIDCNYFLCDATPSVVANRLKKARQGHILPTRLLVRDLDSDKTHHVDAYEIEAPSISSKKGFVTKDGRLVMEHGGEHVFIGGRYKVTED